MLISYAGRYLCVEESYLLCYSLIFPGNHLNISTYWRKIVVAKLRKKRFWLKSQIHYLNLFWNWLFSAFGQCIWCSEYLSSQNLSPRAIKLEKMLPYSTHIVYMIFQLYNLPMSVCSEICISACIAIKENKNRAHMEMYVSAHRKHRLMRGH